MSLKIKGLYLHGQNYWYRQTINGKQVRTSLQTRTFIEAVRKIQSLTAQKSPPVVKDTENRGGMIYLIRCGEFYKIGITQNVEQRLENFKTSNPHSIEMLRTWHYKPWSMVQKIERLLHHHHSPFHHQGEWFKLPNHVVEKLLGTDQLIRCHCTPGKPIELTI